MAWLHDETAFRSFYILIFNGNFYHDYLYELGR